MSDAAARSGDAAVAGAAHRGDLHHVAGVGRVDHLAAADVHADVVHGACRRRRGRPAAAARPRCAGCRHAARPRCGAATTPAWAHDQSISPEQSNPAGVVPPQRYGRAETGHRCGDRCGGPPVRRGARGSARSRCGRRGGGRRRRCRRCRRSWLDPGWPPCGAAVVAGVLAAAAAACSASRSLRRAASAASRRSRSAASACVELAVGAVQQLVVAVDAGLQVGDDPGLAVLRRRQLLGGRVELGRHGPRGRTCSPCTRRQPARGRRAGSRA